MIASSNVRGKRLPMTSVTGRLWRKDVPKSPEVTILAIHWKYCAATFLSNPRRSRIASAWGSNSS